MLACFGNFSSPGHRCCRIGWDYVAQVKANTVLVGESNGYDLDEYRDIVHSKETFDKLTALVYQTYATGEKISLVVKNKVLFSAEEKSEQSESVS
ncbi:MAG: hypothetical protein IJP75_01585 [Bacteroidaceae bacterium]|nr:hypothetical protein [Bacteroidaceae bacterium]